MSHNNAIACDSAEADWLCSVLARVQYETGVPGIVVAVWHSDTVDIASVGVAAMGRDKGLSERSMFQVSCLMKLLVSITALQRAGRRELDLETPIVEFLPELDKPDARGIRVKHLLSHCAGYRGVDVSNANVNWAFTWARFVDHFQRNAQLFAPGLVFSYEHTDHVILGEILKRTSGREVCDLVREEVEAPLGVNLRFGLEDKESVHYVGRHVFSIERGYRPVSTPAFCNFWIPSLPAATLSLLDALHIARELANGGDSRVFLDTTVQKLQSDIIVMPSQAASGPDCEQLPIAFTSGCGRYGNGLLGHNGSTVGQTCAIRYDSQRRFAIAVGLNSWVPHARDLIVHRVCEGLGLQRGSQPGHPGDRMINRRSDILGPFLPSEVCGEYVGSYRGSVLVRLEGEDINVECGTASPRPVRLHACKVRGSEDSYTVSGPTPCSMAFLAEPNGGRPMLLLGVYAYKKA